MKKSIVVVCLLLVFASLALAENANKFQIYTERTGFMGISGKRTIMLDKETGDSWVLQEGQWVAVPKVEPQLKAEEEKARMEERIAVLKAKQEEEINALKAKQDAELKAVVEKKKETAQVVEVRTKIIRPLKPKVAATKAKPVATEDNQGDEAPPAWLSE